MRILLIEDDKTVSQNIALVLKRSGMIVDTVFMGEEGLEISKHYDYDLIILGTSTWYLGELQSDMDNFRAALTDVDLSGKTFALFGLGNQVDYSDYFVDGMGILYNFLKDKGARIIGSWPVDGYDFASQLSLTEDGESFVGLALDEDNQPDETPERIAEWVEQVKSEAGIS